MANSHKLGTAELLYRCAQQMGLHPVWVTPDDTFAVSIAGREKYINLARSPLNSHSSSDLAKDKHLTRLIMERHKMPNIPFARPKTQAQAAMFLGTHGKIIAKPVTGAGAHDIHVVTQVEQLEALQIDKYILEKYIAGKELRYLILNDMVIGVHRSDYGTSVEETRPLKRISFPQAAWNPVLISSSLHIARILDLKFAAVDYLIDASGRTYILEVNTMPGLKWFHAPSSGPVVDVARQFLEAVLEAQTPDFTLNDELPLETHPVIAYT